MIKYGSFTDGRLRMVVYGWSFTDGRLRMVVYGFWVVTIFFGDNNLETRVLIRCVYKILTIYLKQRIFCFNDIYDASRRHPPIF
jgi:hypothetical protein